MIDDYEGAPVFDCIHKGNHFEVKSIDDNNIVTIEKPCTVIGVDSKVETLKVGFITLKSENDHFMMVLKGK